MASLAIDWSLMVDGPGRTVEGLEDVAQCVRVILTTPVRSDPHRPDFGCDLLWIDRPVTEAGPGIIGAVRDALERWEPRIAVLDVAVSAAGAAVTVAVTWRPVGALGSPETTAVVFR